MVKHTNISPCQQSHMDHKTSLLAGNMWKDHIIEDQRSRGWNMWPEIYFVGAQFRKGLKLLSDSFE